MKLPTVLTLLALALPVLAQEPPGTPDGNPPPPPKPGFEPGRPKFEKRDHMLENLNPEQRKRFQEARMKALQDPKIQELRKKAEASNREFFDAMKAKMKEIDPGLEGLLKDAMEPPKDGGHGPGFNKKGEFKDRGLGNLSEGERQRLMAARENAKNDPAVLAAEQKRQQATTPEQRMEAGRQYMEAMKAAILKMEPSMAEILEKIQPPKRPKGPPPTSNPGPEGMEGPEA